MVEKLSKKEIIVKEADSFFSKYGYEATHLEAIAKECGITKPAIYYHFKDKSALYETVVLQHFTALADVIVANTQNEDPLKDLKSYIQTFGNYLIDTPSFSAIFSRELANGAKSLPHSCILALSRTLECLEKILHQGKKQKIFECENPFMVQMMIVTTLSSYITTKELRKRVFDVLENRDEHIDPDIKDVIENLTEKIIKALTC